MKTFLIILIAELVDCNLPSLQQVSCSGSNRLAELSFVTCIELKDFRNATVLKVVDLDRKALQHLKDLLDNLVGRVAAIRVLHQPLLEELASSKFQELILNSFASEKFADLS